MNTKTVRMIRLVPMLPVESLARALGFYCDQLGFDVETRRDDWGWAMLRHGDVRLMLDQSIRQPAGGTREAVVYLYPDDVRAYHAQLRQRGVQLPDLDATFYGHVEFRLEDPDGNRLWIGQAQADAG